MYTEKYSPKKLADIIGQKEAISQAVAWLSSWKKGRALLFAGPPGCGKTSLANVLAAENNFDLIEINASDYRKKDDIESIIGESSKQVSLFRKGKIILVDEVDGASGREDKGGIAAIIDVIKESSFPIILTANDPYDQKLRSLRNYCTIAKFSRVNTNSVYSYLKEISKKENLGLGDDEIKSVAREAGCDLRAALNDLQAMSLGSDRERGQPIFESLKVIFKTSSLKLAREMVDKCELDMGDMFWWVENNIAAEYEKPEEIAKAFDSLSDLLASVAIAKKEMYRKFTPYRSPRAFFPQRSSDAKKRLASLLHTSSKRLDEYSGVLKQMKKEDYIKLGLSEEEASSFS
ncbi:MAG: replication factor C large subunit [Candidatus Aenigmarchaeota archaeon]|nr:replication factor C large subunit [Candidatus Aenigmarchaeota archaeon]